MAERNAIDDVRLLCYDPDALAARVQVTGLMLASDLPLAYEEQRSQYNDPMALVPNPDTFRPCSPGEIAKYIHPVDRQVRRETDVIVYLGQDASRLGEMVAALPLSPRWFGYAESKAGQLTTTLHDPTMSRRDREGVHVDTGEAFMHRLGVCVAGSRQLLVGTRSVRSILGRAELSTSAVRQRLSQDPSLLGSITCLSVLFEAGEAYDAWTGTLLHDGSTWLTNRGEDDLLASAIIFAPL